MEKKVKSIFRGDISQPEESVDKLAFGGSSSSETPPNMQGNVPVMQNPASVSLHNALASIQPHLDSIIQRAIEPTDRVGRISEAVHLSLALTLGVYAQNLPTFPQLSLRFYTISTDIRAIIDVISTYQRGGARLSLLATVLHKLWTPLLGNMTV